MGERLGRVDLAVAIREAHHNVLALGAEWMTKLGEDEQFIVPAGPGSFVCGMDRFRDASTGDVSVRIHARSWLDRDS